MLTFKYNKAGWMSMVGLGLALGCGSLSGLCASEAAAPAPVVVSDDDWIFDEKDNLFFFKTVLDQKSARIIEWRNERWLIEAQNITLIQTPAVNPMPRKDNGLSDKQLMNGMLSRVAPVQVSDAAPVVAEAAPSISIGLNFDFGSDHGGHHHDHDGSVGSNPHHEAGFGNDVINPNPIQTPTAPGTQIVPGTFGTTVAQPVNQTLPTGTNMGNTGNTVPGSNPGSVGFPGSTGTMGTAGNNTNGNTGTGSNGGTSGRGTNALQNDLQNDFTDAKNLTGRNIQRGKDIVDPVADHARQDINDANTYENNYFQAKGNFIRNANPNDPAGTLRDGKEFVAGQTNDAVNLGSTVVDRTGKDVTNTVNQTTEGAKDTANTLGQDVTKTAQDGVNTVTDAAQNTGNAAQNAWNNATSNAPHIGSNPNNVPPKGWNSAQNTSSPLVKNSGMTQGYEPVRNYQPISNNFNKNNYSLNTSKSGSSSIKGNAPTYTQQSSQNTLNNNALRSRKSR